MADDKAAVETKGTLEERKLALDEKRLSLESSFARKWFPTLATVIAGVVATMFGFMQQRSVAQANAGVTQRAEAAARDSKEKEWGFKTVELYFNKRELFDLTRNPQQAGRNLLVLVQVAPDALKGVLEAESASLPPPGSGDQTERLESLEALASVQQALAERKVATEPPVDVAQPEFLPGKFMVYVQYPEGRSDFANAARKALLQLGYKAPGTEQVKSAPGQIELRYYRPEQQVFAAQLVTELGKQLGLPAGAANAKQLASRKALPNGIMELWLPAQGGQLPASPAVPG